MSDIVGQLILQLVLILLNAFFAATEIAVISLNEKKVKARAESGDKKAKKMLKMIEEPTGFLSTIQVGITLAGFLGSAFAADNFAERLSGFVAKTFNVSEAQLGLIDTASVIVITLVLSFFTLVLGELVPKRVAMKHKEKFAEAVCSVITVLAVVLKPVIWLLTVSTNGVIRLFGIDPNDKDEPVSEEDIVLMLDAGADEGTLNENDIEYIKNVFKLDGRTAEDVMSPRKNIVLIPHSASKEEVFQLIEKEGYSRIPVFKNTSDNIIGVLHSSDFLLKYNRPDFKIEDVIVKPYFVPESAHLDVLFKDMQKSHTHIAVVVNEYGETAGIVTLEDILEEIVGEIWDERDEAVESIKKIFDNCYRVLCSVNTDEFFEYFDITPDAETEATTLNGWIVELTGNIPKDGFTFDYQSLNITVTKATNLMALEAKVTIKTANE